MTTHLKSGLSDTQQSMLDLALACDLKTTDAGQHAAIRSRHAAIKSQQDAADYIREVENKVHSRRKFGVFKAAGTDNKNDPKIVSEYCWNKYETGQNDIAGHKIHNILAKCSDFVIYFCEETPGYLDLYYECTDELLEDMATPDESLAKINRLLPDNPGERKEILELVADAFEMWLCGHKDKSRTILEDIVDQLKTTREGLGRLCYQSAAGWVTVFIWLFYLVLHGSGLMPPGWESWLLAAALGSVGGVFSVCLNLAKITVNVNQSSKFLQSAGRTRAIVATIAAIACLLAIRAKIILGLAAGGEKITLEGLTMVEMFFCFLAGFSETFIPNVLRDAEKNAPTATEPAKKEPAKPN